MHWIVAAAVLARAGAFVPARTPKITAVAYGELAASKEQDAEDDWRRLANSKDAAADYLVRARGAMASPKFSNFGLYTAPDGQKSRNVPDRSEKVKTRFFANLNLDPGDFINVLYDVFG